MRDTHKIEEYGIVNFSRALAEALANGYKLDLEDNDGVPTTYGGFHECIMYKDIPEDVQAPVVDTQVITKVDVADLQSVLTDVITNIVDAAPETNKVEVQADATPEVQAESAILKARAGRPKKSASTEAKVEG